MKINWNAQFFAILLTSGCASAELDSSIMISQSETSHVAPFSDPATIAPPPQQIIEKSGYFPVEGGNLWYTDSGGHGPAVILLHANTGTALSWGYQSQALFDAGYRVLTYSRRGAYKSTAPRAKQTTHIDDLKAFLDFLELDKVHILGTAGGGTVMIRFAHAHPNRVQSLILASSQGGIADDELNEPFFGLLSPELVSLPDFEKELSASYRYANPAGVREWLEIRNESASGSAAESTMNLEEKFNFIREFFSVGPSLNDLAQLECPIQLIYGGADALTPPSLGRIILSRLPNAKLAIIPEAGHSAFWEQPESFNKTVLTFLDAQY